MRTLLALLLCLAAAHAASAPSLSVNGREVDGLTLSLVEGVSYAPAGAYAEALGAGMVIDYGSALVSLELGGRLLVLNTFNDASAAGGEGVTIQVNGQRRPGRGGVFSGGQLYLPVSVVAQALLGYTTYVQDREQVLVVLPRGRLTDLDLERNGRADRLVASLASNVPYTVYYNEPVNTLEVRFDRTDDGGVEGVEGGRHLRQAAVLAGRGTAELRISLNEDVDYRVYTVPAGRGYQLVVDLFREVASPRDEIPPPLVVLDPAHGGDDAGVSESGQPEEGVLTLELARGLSDALEQRGMRAELSRDEDHSLPLNSRSSMGVGADLFLSIHVHPGTSDSISVYYLSEAEGTASLDLAIRQNAESELENATDNLRRRLLLNLVPDLEVGRRYAQGLSGELFALSGLSVSEARPAPLAVLAGAAGRGLLLEIPASEAASGRLIDALAEVVGVLLRGREQNR